MRPFLGLSLLALASVASAQNLVFNGDFSLGNTGFSTNYTYAAPATDALFPENVYTIVANTLHPYNLNDRGAGMADYNDHTTGTGLFMAVNGSTTFNSLVWQQTLTGLTVGQTYRFGTWVSRWTLSNEAPASLQVTAGNILITNFADPDVSGVWEERTGLFTATSTSMSLQIRSLETALAGNDFGLDDISVQAVPEPASLIAMGVGVVAMVRRRTARRI